MGRFLKEPLGTPDSSELSGAGSLGPGGAAGFRQAGFVSVVGRMLGEWKPWSMLRVWT
jgi:hypothetical protein